MAEFKHNSHAWLTRRQYKTGGGFEQVSFLVRVMTIAEGYAMVRRPGCAPFVEPLSALDFIKPAASIRTTGEAER